MASFNLFGFTIGREDKQSQLKKQSFITPIAEDGASTVSAGGYYGTFVDIDASARSESELISRYREISNYPDCDTAIEEIVVEAIAAIDSEEPVRINLDDLKLSPNIKKPSSKSSVKFFRFWTLKTRLTTSSVAGMWTVASIIRS